LAMVMLLFFGCSGGPLGREPASRAKERHGGDREKKEKRTHVVFDTAPFDVKRASLPPHYDGHDIMKVYESLKPGGTPPEDGENRPRTGEARGSAPMRSGRASPRALRAISSGTTRIMAPSRSASGSSPFSTQRETSEETALPLL
jgi:hypothetical protein